MCSFPSGRTLCGVLVVPFALLLAASPGPAQEGGVAGQVTDAESGSALAAVQVRVVAASGRVVAEGGTGAGGAYRVGGVPAGEYTLVFTVSGWEEHREEGIRVRSGEITRATVSLRPRSYTLNPITVSASRGAQKLLDAPASISVVSEREIQSGVGLTAMDHVENEAGVDVIRSGLRQGSVVTRGFNNVFSGSLLYLTDYRIARVPSLRANIMHLNPATNVETERIEVVRGPGSALYGPNAASGVLHVLTKSPIDDPESSISVAGGLREQDAGTGVAASDEGAFFTEGRIAHRFSDQFGIDVSGQFFSADDYRFVDPLEEQNRQVAGGCLALYALQNPACQVFAPQAGQLPARERLQKIGDRDFDLEEWSLSADAEWRPEENSSLILSYGRSQAATSIDLTGIGAAQVDDWASQYAQARLNVDRLFVQGFVNWSDAGDTFILRTGQPIQDESLLAVGQIQHSAQAGSGQRFVYGVDLLRTVPKTNGSINGIHEDDDEFTEVGAYLQSETSLGGGWDLTLAARGDYHSVLDEVIFSPRAALSYKPAAGHTLRATFNRAYSTPDNNNLFLDITAQRVPVTGPFSYGLQAMGTTDRGFSFNRIGGRPGMKSPFAILVGQNPGAFMPTSTPNLWAMARELIRQQNPQAAALMDAAGTPDEGAVSVVLRVLNTGEGREQAPFLPFGGFDRIDDLPPVQEELTNTWEVGYKGLIGERLLLSADVYFSLVQDFIGPLRVETPNAFLNGQEVAAWLATRTPASPQQAGAIAEQVARIPLGVVQPQEVSTPGPSMLLTYQNFGDVEVFGADLSAELELSDHWNWNLATSLVSDEQFEAGGVPVSLNAPSFKLKSRLGYRGGETGFESHLSYRFVDSFRAESGVFVGDVDAYHLFDLSLGYQVPGAADVRFRVDVRNLFDNSHSTFPGSPTLGRFTLARLVYSF